jgi:hypothetical protein
LNDWLRSTAVGQVRLFRSPVFIDTQKGEAEDSASVALPEPAQEDDGIKRGDGSKVSFDRSPRRGVILGVTVKNNLAIKMDFATELAREDLENAAGYGQTHG